MSLKNINIKKDKKLALKTEKASFWLDLERIKDDIYH